MLPVSHHYEGLYRLQVRGQLLDHHGKREVEEQHPVLSVVDDIDQLFRKQTRVDRVQNGATTGHPEVKLVVSIGIPGQGAYPVLERHAQGLEHVG